MAPTRKARKTRKNKTMRKAKASPALVRTIKKVAVSQALSVLDTKFVASYLNGSSFNSAINTGGLEMYSLIPYVSRSDTQNEYTRSGSEISPISCRSVWHLALGSVTRTTNIKVVLYCLQSKKDRNFTELLANTGITGPPILKSGQATAITPYLGFITNNALPINNDDFTILKKFEFHLAKNVGLPNDDTTVGNSPNASPSYKMISYNYKCPKVFRYTPNLPTGGIDYPTNHAPFWVCGYAHTDGRTPDALNQDLRVSCTTMLTYKDA